MEASKDVTLGHITDTSKRVDGFSKGDTVSVARGGGEGGEGNSFRLFPALTIYLWRKIKCY